MTNFKYLFFAFILSSCNFGNSEPAHNSDPSDELMDQHSETLKKAPDFNVTTIDGKTVSLKKSIEENKPVMIYFTASWCPMCAQNWPAISEVYPEYEDRINFVAISIDPTDDKEVMTKLAKEKNLNFPVAPGNPQVMLDFGVDSQATTVGINENGYVAFQKDKTVLSAEEYRKLFEKLVN